MRMGKIRWNKGVLKKRTLIKRSVVGLLAVLIVGVAAGCGSSSSSSSSSEPSSSSGSTDQAGLKAAEAAVAEALKEPTAIPVSTPLKSPAPSGEKFVYMQCSVPACQIVKEKLEEATKAIGWSLVTITYNEADPSTLVSGMKQALRYNPAAVGLSGTAEALWSSVLPEYESANVPIVTHSVGPVNVKPPIIAAISGLEANAYPGEVLGNWMVAESEGKGSALVVTVPSFPVLKETAEGTTGAVEKNCPECSVTSLEASLQELSNGGIVPAVVSALRRDPSIKYVLGADGAFLEGLPEALSAADISDVKIGSARPSLANEQNVADGKEAAVVGFDDTVASWLMIDATLRHMQGMPIPTSESNLPAQLLTEENIGTPEPTLIVPKDYAEQFSKLWGVSK